MNRLLLYILTFLQLSGAHRLRKSGHPASRNRRQLCMFRQKAQCWFRGNRRVWCGYRCLVRRVESVKSCNNNAEIIGGSASSAVSQSVSQRWNQRTDVIGNFEWNSRLSEACLAWRVLALPHVRPLTLTSSNSKPSSDGAYF